MVFADPCIVEPYAPETLCARRTRGGCRASYSKASCDPVNSQSTGPRAREWLWSPCPHGTRIVTGGTYQRVIILAVAVLRLPSSFRPRTHSPCRHRTSCLGMQLGMYAVGTSCSRFVVQALVERHGSPASQCRRPAVLVLRCVASGRTDSFGMTSEWSKQRTVAHANSCAGESLWLRVAVKAVSHRQDR